MALTYTSYVKESFPFMGGTIALELRAMDSRQAPEFKARVMTRFADLERREGETEAEHEARATERMAEWNAYTREVFSQTYTTKKGEVRGYYLRVAEPLINEEDDDADITDGASLFARAPHDFRFAVMLKLAQLAALGDTDAKSSGSPSTSTVEAGRHIASSGNPAAIQDTRLSLVNSIVPEPNATDPYSRLA